MTTPNRLLEAARMKKRWSVALASRKAGVSINTFNRWERGLQVPQLGTLDQLCNAFDLTPEELGFGHAVVSRRRSTSALETGASSSSCQLEGRPTASAETDNKYTRLQNDDGYFNDEPLYVISDDNASGAIHWNAPDMGWTWMAKEEDCVMPEGVSRRRALMTLLSTPAAVLGGVQEERDEVLRPEEALSLCSMCIPLAWRLYFEGGLTEVEHLLPGYLMQLKFLAQKPSSQRLQALELASMGYQLASLVALQHQNYGLALQHSQQAFFYGEQLQDANLQAASLIRQAQVYLYLHRPRQRLRIYDRALQHIAGATPLMQGRVYIGMTETHAQLGHERDAQRYLDLAHHTFPEQCENDPCFSYTHFNQWSLNALEGLMYLNLRRYQQACSLFVQVDKTVPQQLVPNRLELIVRQASACCALGEMEPACMYVESALKAALAVGNQLRYDEAYIVYEQMREKWGRERRVQELAALVH